MPHEVYNAPHGSKRSMYASTVLALDEEREEARRNHAKQKGGVV